MHHRFNMNGDEVEVTLSKTDEGWVWEGATVNRHARGRLHVTMADGRTALVHAAKVGDVWWVHLDGHTVALERMEPGASSQQHGGGLVAPMPGKVLETLVEPGETVQAGQALMVLEAMKMEHRIVAAHDGTVTAVHHQAGEQVSQGAVLLELEEFN